MYCRLPKTRTLATLNFMLSQTKTVFPLDFCDTITVILPLVTWTLDNSTFLLTRRNFHFPLGHFLHNFNLDNSNREHEHKYQYWQLCTSSQTLFSLKKKHVQFTVPGFLPATFLCHIFHFMLPSDLYSNLYMHCFAFTWLLYSVIKFDCTAWKEKH